MNMKRRNSRAKTSVRSPNRLKDALRRQLRTETLERRDLMSIDGFNPYHNYDFPADTNFDNNLNAMDALLVINALNSNGGSKRLSPDGSDLPVGRYLDVDGDGHLSAIDALNVINNINGEGEGALARLTLAKTDMLGNPLTGFNLPVNTRFRLVTSIQDIRTSPEGVFAVGTNIVNSNPTSIRLLVGETQLLSLANEVTGGTFTLTYNGQTTAAITFSTVATTMATRITTALNPIIGSSNFRVRSVPGTRNYMISFHDNLIDTNVSPITGNFSNLSTSNSNVASGTVTDNFYPADPTNVGAFRNTIDWLTPPEFPVATTNEVVIPSAGTYLNIGALKEAFSDPEPDVIKPAFALFFETVDVGLAQFSQTFADPLKVPVGLFSTNEDLDALTESQIEFGTLTVNVVRNLTAVDDTATVAEDTTTFTNINVLSNDVSIIAAPQGNFSITGTTSPANGTINVVTVNNVQQIAYRPNANFFGTDTFTYTIANQNSPVDTDTATVTVTVTAVNDAPIANADTVTAVEDTPRQIDANELLANDTPGAGESDIFVINDVESVTAGGSVSLNVNGNVDFTPATDFNGQYRFRYRIRDNGTPNATSAYATVVVNVSAVNDAPITVDDSVTGAIEDVARTIAISTLLGNDLPGPATATDEQRPNQNVNLLVASVSATSSQGGSVQVVGNNIVYTSALNFSGTDTFTYNIEDTGSPVLSATRNATVTITVVADNDPPVANDDTYDIDEFSNDNELDVLSNDNPGSGETSTDTMSIQSFTQPANGVVTKTNINGRDILLYTPNDDYIGGDTFTYTIVDGGGKTDSATVTIDVVPVIRPRARTDRYTLAEDSTNFTLNVMSNDLANVGNFKTTLLSFTQPSNGTLTRNENGTPADLTDDVLLYTPASNYFGSDSFTYTINDTAGIGVDSVATVNLTITEVNDAPSAVGDTLTSTEDVVLTIQASSLLGNDSTGPANESSQTLSVFSVTAVSSGGTVSIENGNVVYRPTAFFNGPFVFSYTARDNGTTAGASDPQTSNSALVTITVSEVNNAPIGQNDSVNGDEDISLTVQLTSILANDRPAPAEATDEQSQTLTVTPGTFTTARGGSVVINGVEAVYTPPENFNGVDSVPYVITDNGTTNGVVTPRSTTLTLTFTMSEVNDAPTAVTDDVVAFKNFPVVFEASRFLANDSTGPANESSQSLTIIEVFALPGTRGTATLNTDGTISYTPQADFVGIDSFGYRIRDNGTTDGALAPQEATGTINVDVKDFIPSSISGIVYGEETGNTQIDNNERFLSGVPVRLVGTALGEPVDVTVYTLADGTYSFENLAPGNYRVIFTPPSDMVDGADITGSHGDSDNVTNQFSINIVPPGNVQATGYNFALSGLELKYALQLDSLASPYYSRDVSLRTHGMFGLIRPGNNAGWTAAMEGYDDIAFAEMVLSSDGTKLVVSVVNHNEEIFTTVLSRGQFVKITDDSGNTLVRVLGGYSKFTWNKVAITAAAPITAAKYLDSVEMIFAQEDWDGIAGN